MWCGQAGGHLAASSHEVHPGKARLIPRNRWEDHFLPKGSFLFSWCTASYEHNPFCALPVSPPLIIRLSSNPMSAWKKSFVATLMRNDYFEDSHIIYSPEHIFMYPRRFLSLKYNAGFFFQSHLIVPPSLTPQTDISIFTDLDRTPNSSAGSYNLLMSPVCLQTPALPFLSEIFSTQSPEMDSKQVRLFSHRDPSGVHFFSNSKNSVVFCLFHFSALPPDHLWQGQNRVLCQPLCFHLQ